MLSIFLPFFTFYAVRPSTMCKCWLCKDPNGIVEQMGVESTSRWGAFLSSVTPDRRPGDYQHAACRILNGIAKRTETTLQALPSSCRKSPNLYSFANASFASKCSRVVVTNSCCATSAAFFALCASF